MIGTVALFALVMAGITLYALGVSALGAAVDRMAHR